MAEPPKPTHVSDAAQPRAATAKLAGSHHAAAEPKAPEVLLKFNQPKALEMKVRDAGASQQPKPTAPTQTVKPAPSRED